eukprot:scaffold638_cov168-Amphora_coffeaeformis.AAC.44
MVKRMCERAVAGGWKPMQEDAIISHLPVHNSSWLLPCLIVGRSNRKRNGRLSTIYIFKFEREHFLGGTKANPLRKMDRPACEEPTTVLGATMSRVTMILESRSYGNRPEDSENIF